MSQELEAIFRELGIAQYLDTFVEQGFDTWDTILDIQESDLDALGVKLGHRRKLQRRIANSRGIAPGASLVSPIQSTAEEARQDAAQKEASREENATEIPTVTKRKYRRHPKTDENAPERPPSAYVLFSNKLREGLRGQTLTFTEIAKLVGENWQSLSPTERERFERQANNAKEKYHREMAQYKKTEEFRQYSQYLQEFKEKQGKSGQGQEPAKRAKIEPTQPTEIVNGSSTASSGTPSSSVALSGSTSIASGNSSERIRESESREPPPSRRHDSVNSVASVAESRHSTATRSTESAPSPRTTHFDVGTPRGGHQRHSRRASSLRGRGPRGDTPQPHLPSLSDVLIEGQRGIAGPTSAEAHGFVPTFIPPTNPRQSVPQSSPAMPLGPVVPIFYHEPSSGTTIHSGPAPGFGRRPGEGPLAIHSLLSEPNSTIRHGYEKSPSSVASATSPIEQVKPLFGPFQGPRSYGTNPFRYDEFGRGRN